MIFSLQRRFLVFLLLPTAVMLILTGALGFVLARNVLLEQWVNSTNERLEKAAVRVNNLLQDKLDLIELIGKTEDIPDSAITQAFLIQQLVEKKGVKFVDVVLPEETGRGDTEGLFTMELCEDIGYCAPMMDADALDRSLRIIKILRGDPMGRNKKLIVRINFNSFLEPVREMTLGQGSRALLVTSTGQFLAHSGKAHWDRKRLGDTGDKLEQQLLKEIRRKPFGTIIGPGYPPDMVMGFQKVPSINWYLILISRGDEILRPIIQFRFQYTLASIGAIILILIFIRLTTRSVAHSIGRIANAAARVEKGDYSATLPEDRSDEIGQLNRSFNRMIKGLKQRDLIETTFGRYVDKNVAEELMNRPDALKLGGEKRVVTVMMADIRNFTGVSERLKPEEVILLLNRHFARMIGVVERYRGIIVDFFGDSILVFFNGSGNNIRERAADAVACALEMQREQEAFVQECLAEGLPELRMGIGIHTGEVIVGNIGTDTRAKYGIVGSDVNLTARIQSTASGGKVVISEETYKSLQGRLKVSNDFSVCLKGLRGDRELYEVESMDEPARMSGTN